MLNEYFDPLYFFIAFAIGMLIVYVTTPVREVVYKYPTPENAGKVIYEDDSGNCYKYKAKEVKCPKDEKEIVVIPIQQVDLEMKDKESIVTQFQKLIKAKSTNNVIMPHN